MQSLSRQIKRGNAVIYFDFVTKKPEIQLKKDSTPAQWKHCLRNASEDAMESFCNSVTKPITKAMMDEAKVKGSRTVINNKM